VVTTMSPILRW